MEEFCLVGEEYHPVFQLNKDIENIEETLIKSWKRCPHDTLKEIFHLRNCRGGKGQRRLFYSCVNWLVRCHPEYLLCNLKSIVKFGYWKDLLIIWECQSELLRACIIYYFCSQLKRDWAILAADVQPSLAAKWAPTEGSALDRKWGLVKLFCEQLGWSPKEYRKRISALRNYLLITERLASDKRWGEIDFDKIPVTSSKLFDKSLRKYCGQRYQKWLNEKTTLGYKEVSIEDSIYSCIKTSVFD